MGSNRLLGGLPNTEGPGFPENRIKRTAQGRPSFYDGTAYATGHRLQGFLTLSNPEVGSSPPLDSAALSVAAGSLARRDPHLAGILEADGPPPLGGRPPGFSTLVHIILEQQVSLSSAQSFYDRLDRTLGPLTPQALLQTGGAGLRSLGVTRQKTESLIDLSHFLLSGRLRLEELVGLEDGEAEALLCKVRGIGVWTARIYLLMALLRPDIWPLGDMALGKAVHEVKELSRPHSQAELEEIAESWRPWRAVAARMLWCRYLAVRVKPKRPPQQRAGNV